MFEYTVTFRLDEAPTPDSADPAFGAWCRRFGSPEQAEWRRAAAKDLGLRIVSFAWHELSLSRAQDLERLQVTLAAAAEGQVHIGKLYVGQRLSHADEDAASHYLLNASAFDCEGYVVLDGDYPTVNAARVPEKYRMFEGTIVSEAVWRKLRTLAPDEDMLWLQDRGRYAARQWYFVNPGPCAGRGVAHEWFSPAHAETAYVTQAATQVGKLQLRSDWARFGDPPPLLSRAVELAAAADLSMPPAFLASQIPDAPLSRAAPPWGEEGILCTRRVRAALLDARVLRPSDFGAVRIVERTEETLELDEELGKLSSQVPRARFEAWKAQSSLLQAAHDAHPKPIRTPNLKKLLSELRRLKRETKDLAPGAKGARVAKIEAELQVKLPDAFARLLAVTAGGEIWVGDNELVLWPLEALPAEHRRVLGDVEASGSPTPPWLFFGSNVGGDTYALDVTGAPTEDAPVVLMDHETDQEEQRWSGVPAFLHWLLHEG